MDLVICLKYALDEVPKSIEECSDCMLNADSYLDPSTTCTSLAEDGFCAAINSCDVCSSYCANEFDAVISCFLVECGGCTGDECSVVFDRSSQGSSVNWN
jgi:hypothetical protein